MLQRQLWQAAEMRRYEPGFDGTLVAFWVQVMGAPNGTSGARLGPQEARIMGRRLLRRRATRA
ncbi:MAG: hypothetical protein ACRDZS_12705, partial [Acidimicrobiales bacterium]